MAKVRVIVKAGAKGKPLGERVAEMRAKEGEKKRMELYKPRVKMMVHFNDGGK